MSICIVPTHETSPRCSGIARIVKWYYSFTCTPCNRKRNEPSIPAFAFPAAAGTHLPTPEDGRLSRPWCKVAPAEIRICSLPITSPALYRTANSTHSITPRAGSGVLRIDRSFPGRISYKATKPGLVSVLYLSIHYMVSFIRAPFYVLLVFIALCTVFWLFWLSYQYLPSDWLERFVYVPILSCFLGQLSHLPYSSWR